MLLAFGRTQALGALDAHREGSHTDAHLAVTNTGDGSEVARERLVIGLNPRVTPAQEQAIHRAAAGAGIELIRSENIGDPALRTRVVQFNPAKATLEQALAAYRGRAGISFAEPDYVAHASEAPNDTFFGSQWSMTKIQAPAAWDVTHGAGSVTVAILDCGIFDEASGRRAADGLLGHPDLRAKVLGDVDFTGSPRGTDDRCGHGTHVAGIAAATTNNAIGVAGVGYNSGLLNAKVLNDSGSGMSSWLVSGISWAVSHGAKVINMSLGAIGSCPTAVQNAIDSAWASSVVIVAAAGNDGTSAIEWPAGCNHVVSVASTDQADAKSSFSNFGAWVQIAAPGSSILSTYSDGSYQTLSGTSMATPHVAGLAALIWATPHGTSAQAVVARLQTTADQIPGTGTLWSYGRINAAAAVASLTTLSASPASVAAGTNVTATWAGIATPTPKDWVGVWAVGQPDTDVTRIAVKYTGGGASGSVALTIPGTTAPGSYEIRLFANDSWTRLAISEVFVVTGP